MTQSLPLQNHPAFLLYDTARLFRGCMGRELQDLGRSEPQWRLVSSVNRFPGASQTELAVLLGIGKAPLGNLVDRLEAEHLLERRSHPTDRRQKQLHLSPAGLDLAERIIQRYTGLRPSIVRDISDIAIDQLETALRQIYRRLLASSPGLGDLPLDQLTVMHLISAINRWNRRKFDLQLKQLGISRPQWLLVVAIAGRECIHQQSLADELQMHKVALGQLVDALESAGWLQRRVDPSDRRARQLSLTPLARAQVHEQASIYEQLHEQSLAGVSANARRQMTSTLRSLRDNLQHIARRQLEAAYGVTA